MNNIHIRPRPALVRDKPVPLSAVQLAAVHAGVATVPRLRHRYLGSVADQLRGYSKIDDDTVDYAITVTLQRLNGLARDAA